MNFFARFSGASKAPNEVADIPSRSPEYSDAAKQRELTVELARLLARRPASPHNATKTPCEFDEPDDEIGDSTLSGIDISGSDAAASAPMSPPPLPGTRRPVTDISEKLPDEFATQVDSDTTHRAADPARWVATSKRARFNTGVRKAASWMISIFTGVFIFAVVALIVLGPPKDYDTIIQWPSKTIALSSTDMTPSHTTRTASDLETRSVKIHQFRLSQDEPVGVFADQGR